MGKKSKRPEGFVSDAKAAFYTALAASGVDFEVSYTDGDNPDETFTALEAWDSAGNLIVQAADGNFALIEAYSVGRIQALDELEIICL